MTNFQLGPNQTKLVEALESGDYKSVSGFLRGKGENYASNLKGDEGFCCLGVAVDLISKGEVDAPDFKDFKWEHGMGAAIDAYVFSPNGEKSHVKSMFRLPSDKIAIEIYGFSTNRGTINYGWSQYLPAEDVRAISEINDKLRYSDDSVACKAFVAKTLDLDYTYESLVDVNDRTLSFTLVSRFIRRFPALIFTKSV